MLENNSTIRPLCALICAGALLFPVIPANAAESDTSSSVEYPVSAELAALRQSAENGSAESQYELGESFEYGRGVNRDDAKAVYWYEKSADQYFAKAQYRLAILYDNGWGSPVNKAKAFKLYKVAAEQGIELAQHDLAIAYFQGSGTTKNLVLAYKWLKIAELSGNPLMQKHLKLVAAEMSSDEIETGKDLAAFWVEQTTGQSF